MKNLDKSLKIMGASALIFINNVFMLQTFTNPIDGSYEMSQSILGLIKLFNFVGVIVFVCGFCLLIKEGISNIVKTIKTIGGSSEDSK